MPLPRLRQLVLVAEQVDPASAELAGLTGLTVAGVVLTLEDA